MLSHSQKQPSRSAIITIAAILMLPSLGSGCASHHGSAVGAGDATLNPSPRMRMRSHTAASVGSAPISAVSAGLVDTAAIERSPAYRRAILSYKHKDYRGALGCVDSLNLTPRLTPEAHGFLQHQHDLCEAAISGKPLTARASNLPRSVRGGRHVRSVSEADCGPRALALVCQKLKTQTNLEALRKAAGTTTDGTSLTGLFKAAQSVHMQAEGVQMDRNALSNLSSPAIAWVDGNHYIAVLGVNGDTATVHDPNKQREEDIPLGGPTGLLARSGGMLLLLSRSRNL